MPSRAVFGFSASGGLESRDMSDLNGLVAVSFLRSFVFFATIYIAKAANRLGAQIATGMIRGTPITVETRKTMLLHIWIHHETGGIALSVFTEGAPSDLTLP